ncbi:TPA: AAC(6')-Ia family aminoglycoside 6'-N-acetyltransferase [Corynebacterium striatum]|nr:AAC(6')-Ia family aminoglycoside 6'-N-acetyltransferase [Corynebacterium striatum]HAT6669490.1 AAC(6')-Ia family aminoglycoside 6'-N-acetyltransferase [Corynebacterium striatum]
MNYQIVNIAECSNYQLEAANILTEAFNDLGNNSWPDMTSATKEVKECIESPNLCFGLLINNSLVGWIGLRPMYKETWELHPLVVRPDYQNKGIGKILLKELENRAREQGIIGIALGTDDEYYRTSLSLITITSLSLITITEDNIFDSIKNIKNINKHPYEFYQKNGYYIVGIIPNANGKNKPDIWMWKSLIKE